MPWPGEISRPDRILVSSTSCLSEREVVVLEGAHPNEYKRHYYWRIVWKRAIEWLPTFAITVDFTHPISIFLVSCPYKQRVYLF